MPRYRPSPALASLSVLSVALLTSACGDSTVVATDSDSGASTATTQSTTATASETGASETGGATQAMTAGTGASGSSTGSTSQASAGSSTTAGPIFDVGDGETTGEPLDMCKVIDDMDAVGDCQQEAPPDSFQQDIQWSWDGDGIYRQIIATPLVANLTDDDDNGEIDLCDTPDVLVNLIGPDAIWHSSARLYALDGAEGTMHWSSAESVWGGVTPAIGDLDGDKVPEIVAVASPANASLAAAHAPKPLLAFASDGSLAWTGDEVPVEACDSYCGIALADLEGDGDVEIIVGHLIYDHEGALVTTLGDGNESFNSWTNIFTTAADLDGDGDLEVVLGRSAYHHDGSEYYMRGELERGTPQIADLDGDGEPEVLLFNPQGISLLEHDGTPVYTNLRPTGDNPSNQNWMRPATIHDMDGDDIPEFAASTGDKYVVYSADAVIQWTSDIDDYTGAAGSTAFDFLGDGTAEAMYADHDHLYIYGPGGASLLESPRSSRTYYEYPVVADVDNDGSAEIVLVSSQNFDSQQTAPSVQVVRDTEERWIQARRIWNQHTYHVTNVREDGTIPASEPPHWATTNTFRTQAQIEEGGVCVPPT